jgi:hypothetical protein
MGAVQHAVLKKIHGQRVGVQYRQSIRIGHGEGSLPLPVTGL